MSAHEKAQRPKLYDDPPGTRVGPSLADSYEVVQRPKRTFVRKKLSKAGARKHDRLEALGKLGWLRISTRGAGMVYRPDNPDHLYSVVAAAVREGIE